MRTKLFIIVALLFSLFANAGKVDLKTSSFKWKATKKVGDGHDGNVKLKSSKLVMKNGAISSGEFVIDMNSITVNGLKGKWEKKFLTHIKSDDFFKVSTFPVAKLKVKEEGKYLVGKLTINGKTNAVKIKFRKKGKNYKGKFTFDRTKFGVIYGAGNFFKALTADKIINNDVKIIFKLNLL